MKSRNRQQPGPFLAFSMPALSPAAAARPSAAFSSTSLLARSPDPPRFFFEAAPGFLGRGFPRENFGLFTMSRIPDLPHSAPNFSSTRRRAGRSPAGRTRSRTSRGPRRDPPRAAWAGPRPGGISSRAPRARASRACPILCPRQPFVRDGPVPVDDGGNLARCLAVLSLHVGGQLRVRPEVLLLVALLQARHAGVAEEFLAPLRLDR